MLFTQFFPFFGPNWHTDFSVMERMFVLDASEIAVLKRDGVKFRDQLVALLEENGVESANLALLQREYPPGAKTRLAFLYTGAAIALQRHAGHDVHYVSSYIAPDRRWFRAIYQFEDSRSGVNADRVVLYLLSELIPGLDYSLQGKKETASISSVLRHYFSRSKSGVLPRDYKELIAAAERAGVPWIKMDQNFFAMKKQAYRIRGDSALLLGQGIHRNIIDGTLCAERSRAAIPFLKDRVSIARKLHTLGIPQPSDSGDPPVCRTLLQAVQAIEALDYPVVIKPVRSRDNTGVSVGVGNVEELIKAVAKAQEVCKPFMIERQVKGDCWRLILVGNELVGVLSEAGIEAPVDALHDSICEWARSISGDLNTGILAITVVTEDSTQALESTGGAIVDLDVAPELDRILPAESPLWELVCDRFIRWLYPPGSPSRIPIIAVTGTNGKTTTCRMISRIMQSAAYQTGLVCSEGAYRNEERIIKARFTEHSRGMFHRILKNEQVELAVMEYFLSRLKQHGFAFDWCNIGVLTNVTGDHLQPGWETPERLAEIKRAVLERARDGVVLNADDPHTHSILPHLTAAKIVLTSVRQTVEEIRSSTLPGKFCVVVEPVAGKQGQIVIYEGAQRQELMAVADIPACFGGKAGFNVENALQAIATAYLVGVKTKTLIDAMASFSMDFEHTPGRQNIYDKLPFRVIMDYAHNDDGMKKLCAFTDQLEVTGKRILMFAISKDRRDDEITATTAAAAGHFDHYICRNYPDFKGMTRIELPEIMRGVLLEAGVQEAQITVCEDPLKARDLALGMAGAGDLLVMTPGILEIEEMWQLIKAGPGAGQQDRAGTTPKPGS